MQIKEQKNIFSYIKQAAERVYFEYGYSEITIPMFARADLYQKYKGVPGNRFVKFLDRNGDVSVIRPDATFNILKKVNACGNKNVQRYFYHTEIVRYKSSDYEQNEFMQSGVEYFNDPSPLCDAEVIAVALKSLLALGIEGIRVDIGHSDYIYALFDGEKHLTKADHQAIHEYIAQKNTVDLDEFLASKKVDPAISKNVLDICMLFGDYPTVIERARALSVNQKMLDALDNIQSIYQCLQAYGLDRYVYLDLGFSNPMEYYSGMIFKVYAQGAKEELISGGRYDKLASKFGLRKYACGFGHNLNLSSMLVPKSEDDSFDTVFACCPEESMTEAITAAEMLRTHGLRVELNLCGEAVSFRYRNKNYTSADEVLQASQAQ